jgi:hypothetical protein
MDKRLSMESTSRVEKHGNEDLPTLRPFFFFLRTLVHPHGAFCMNLLALAASPLPPMTAISAAPVPASWIAALFYAPFGWRVASSSRASVEREMKKPARHHAIPWRFPRGRAPLVPRGRRRCRKPRVCPARVGPRIRCACVLCLRRAQDSKASGNFACFSRRAVCPPTCRSFEFGPRCRPSRSRVRSNSLLFVSRPRPTSRIGTARTSQNSARSTTNSSRPTTRRSSYTPSLSAVCDQTPSSLHFR